MYLRVYLSGPINGCNDDECQTWRLWFHERLPKSMNYWAIDPMARDYRGREEECYREIVELDKRDIKSCDVMLVMYTRPSVGTSMEVLYAWSLGIPVILIDESIQRLSPWMRYHATTIVETKEQALEKLQDHWNWKRATWNLIS